MRFQAWHLGSGHYSWQGGGGIPKIVHIQNLPRSIIAHYHFDHPPPNLCTKIPPPNDQTNLCVLRHMTIHHMNHMYICNQTMYLCAFVDRA